MVFLFQLDECLLWNVVPDSAFTVLISPDVNALLTRTPKRI